MNLTKGNDVVKWFLGLKPVVNFRCLYCGLLAKEASHGESEGPHVKFNCLKCLEYYTLWNDNFGFNFTCRELLIYACRDDDFLLTRRLEDESGYWTRIPLFKPNFADRDGLHDKLKTYLLLG